jgi:hypothetical protein
MANSLKSDTVQESVNNIFGKLHDESPKELQPVIKAIDGFANAFLGITKGVEHLTKVAADEFAKSQKAKTSSDSKPSTKIDVLKELAKFRSLECEDMNSRDIADDMVKFFRIIDKSDGIYDKKIKSVKPENLAIIEESLKNPKFNLAVFKIDWQKKCDDMQEDGEVFHMLRKSKSQAADNADKAYTQSHESDTSPLKDSQTPVGHHEL